MSEYRSRHAIRKHLMYWGRKIWKALRDPKNSALCFILTTLGTLVLFVWNSLVPPPASPPARTATLAIVKNAEPVRNAFLPEESWRAAITAALHGDRLEAAIPLINQAPNDSARAEECIRMFSYGVKNGKENETRMVKEACESGNRH